MRDYSFTGKNKSTLAQNGSRFISILLHNSEFGIPNFEFRNLHYEFRNSEL